VNKQAIIGGIFRVFATGGSGMRLAEWCRRRIGRKLGIDLEYTEQGPIWHLVLTDHDGSQVFNETSESLEGVIVRAVVALGKGF